MGEQYSCYLAKQEIQKKKNYCIFQFERSTDHVPWRPSGGGIVRFVPGRFQQEIPPRFAE